MNEKGITTILITHFMEEAASADKVIVMDSGSIVMEGTPEEIFKRGTELIELGLGVPAPVELAMELRKRGFDIPDDIQTTDRLVERLTK